MVTVTRYAQPTPRNQKDYPSTGVTIGVCAILIAILFGAIWAGYSGMIDTATEAEQRPSTYRITKDSLNRVYTNDEDVVGYAYVDIDPETGAQTKIYVFPGVGVTAVPRLDSYGRVMGTRDPEATAWE